MKFSVRLLLIPIVLIFILSSCSNSPKQVSYLPKGTFVAGKINTQSLLTDNFFELLGDYSLLEKMTKNKDIEMNPSEWGFDRLAEYYLFATGENLKSIKIGAIFPLNDQAKIAKMLSENHGFKIEKGQDYSYANPEENYTIIWNNEVAVFYFSPKGGAKEGAMSLINKESVLDISHKSFDEFVESSGHVCFWLDNKKYLEASSDESIASLVNFDYEDIMGELLNNSYSLSEVNFENGAVVLDSKSFLSKKQKELLEKLEKENNIDPLVKSVASENPMALLSYSVDFKGVKVILEMIPDLVSTLDDQLGMTTVDDILEIISGDVLITFNGMEKSINDWGFETKLPVTTLAIGLNKQEELITMLQPLLAFAGDRIIKATEEEIHLTLDQGIEAKIKDNMILVGVSQKGIKAINSLNGKLAEAPQKRVSEFPVGFYVDIDGIANELKEEETELIIAVVDKYFNDLFLDEVISESKYRKSTIKLTLKNNKSSFIQILKFIEEFNEAIEKNKALSQKRYEAMMQKVLEEEAATEFDVAEGEK